MSLTYPLKWPANRPRQRYRRPGKFRDTIYSPANEAISVNRALTRLQQQLDLLRGRYPVVTTNLETRLDGFARERQREPDDPAVAVYFSIGKKTYCLPCDTFDSVAQNIAAVAAHIDAVRRIERYGVGTLNDLFAGFLALPAPAPSDERPWREVLELHRTPTVTLDDAETAYRRLARERHPDLGGSDAMMAELNRARDQAREELR